MTIRKEIHVAVLLSAAVLALASCGGGTTIGSSTPPLSSSGTSGTPAASATASSAPGGSNTPAPGASSTSGSTPTAPASSASIPFPSATDSDPFYAQPKPFPNVPNGTILASRSVTYEPDSVAQPNAAWELKFASRDVNGNPIAATAAVAKPLVAPSGAANVLVENFAEDALSPECAPSHDVTGGNTDTDETGVPDLGSSLSWTLIYPDFEGPSSEYAAGRLEGQIVLDSIKAAEQFAPLGLNAQTKVGINGYSGGAIAASWASSLEASYAPGLNIVGVTSGGTPADISGIVNNIDTDMVSNSLFFDLIFTAAVGINRAYPEFLTPSLNAAGVTAATMSASGCGGKYTGASSGPTGTFATYTNGNILTAPGFIAGNALDMLAQPNETPVTNEFVYHSVTDELIPIAGADAMVKAWCAAGAKIGYYRALSGDHVTTELVNEQFVIAFLTAKFNGIAPVYPPTTTTCN
jgi:hypothetical protein